MIQLHITKLILIASLFISSYACEIGQDVDMPRPILPQLIIPENALLLYENVAISDPERTGNWRFFVQEDGCFFHARNSQLWIEDLDRISSSDPDLHWNRPFSNTPDRCLTEAQKSDLISAINQADFPSLQEFYPTPPEHQVSHPSAERWSVIQNDIPQTVIVENGFSPSELVQLRLKIDQIVADAPQAKPL